jgi:diadenosine tetraphosphate (Ap4A) HIT family hydrolase
VTIAGCPLCETDGGTLIFKNDQLRVIHAVEAGFPAFYRVVWNTHIAEFSSLSVDERNACMNAVVAVEQVLREQLQPTKINLAALGNAVPHLHWHVIARFDWDSHFPGSVWAAPQRTADAAKLMQLALQCKQINLLLAAELKV